VLRYFLNSLLYQIIDASTIIRKGAKKTTIIMSVAGDIPNPPPKSFFFHVFDNLQTQYPTLIK